MAGWDWGDIRCFLGVARGGTTLRASQQLGMNQTTCARRISALEAGLGFRLFDKSPTGYSLTPQGEALIPAAEALEHTGEDFAKAADGLRRIEGGVIRITVTDVLADAIVAPAVVSFRDVYPDVLVEIDISGRIAELERGEADIALRAGRDAGGHPSLVVRKMPGTVWGVYCAESYAKMHGMPSGMHEVARHPVATLDGAPLDSLRQLTPAVDVVQVTNSMSSLIATLRGGYCIAAMPCLVGDAVSELLRCFVVDPDEQNALWLVYPERLRGVPHIRAFLDALAEQTEALKPQLLGRA